MISFLRYLETSREFLSQNENYSDKKPEIYAGVNIPLLVESLQKEINVSNINWAVDSWITYDLNLWGKLDDFNLHEGSIKIHISRPDGGKERRVTLNFGYKTIPNAAVSVGGAGGKLPNISEFRFDQEAWEKGTALSTNGYIKDESIDNNFIIPLIIKKFKIAIPEQVKEIFDRSVRWLKKIDESNAMLKNFESFENLPIEIQKLMILKDPSSIQYINNPDRSIQDKVIEEDPKNFLHIKNPDPDLEKKYKYLRSVKKAGIMR